MRPGVQGGWSGLVRTGQAAATGRSSSLVLRFQAWRTWLVLGGLMGLLLILIGRAAYLMGWNETFLQEQGQARYSRVIRLEANRGMITDRNGEPLAISTPVQSIWASPSDMEPLSPRLLKELARVLELPESEISRKLADRKRDFVFLKRQLSPEKSDRVLALGIPGISKQTEYRRYYPAGEMMAHIIGFTDIDGKGQEGLELTREAMLAGKPGSRHVIKDRRGYIVEDVTSIEQPKDGQTLTLSIDRRIQYLAYRELKSAVEANHAKAGGIVVLDARTGEVLALANVPSYNPNSRNLNDPAARRNRALTDLLEPGSVMKPISVSAALDRNIVQPTTVIATGASFTIGPNTVRDVHASGALSTEQIIQKSSNVGTAKIALKLDREELWSMYDAVGFGQAPHSGFPGEASGRLRAWKTWRPIEQATMSYGYGVSVSLMQMAKSYQIFAGDGQIRPITFQKLVAPLPGKQVIKPETAAAMRKMLEMVTLPGGTAPKAQVVGYRVGGKTGTAHKLVNGGYAEDRYIASFVGLAPISDPRLIVGVMIDEPSAGQHYGGLVSAPVFSAVVKECMRMLGIPPDAPVNNILLPDTNQQDVKEDV